MSAADSELVQQVVKLRDLGWTLQQIADRLRLGSRQHVWQLLKAAAGRCRVCGLAAHPKSFGLCEKHVLSTREKQREKVGCGIGAETGIGRPTIL